MRRFVTLADDLTGASASAGALAAGLGMSVPIMERIPDVLDRTLVLNTRSREDPGRSGIITAWVQQLWDMGYRDFDKRIDTTLRGPTPYELHLLLKALPVDPWVGVIAAYPSAGRTTRDGRQYLHGSPVAGVLPEVGTDDLGQYLFPHSAPLKIISREALERDTDAVVVDLLTVRRVCFDASSDEDLRRIGEILHRLRGTIADPMVTVTSGEVLEHYPGRGPSRVVIVVGSPTRINLDQIAYLQGHQAVELRHLTDPIGEGTHASTIIFHSGLQPIDARGRQPITQELAKSAKDRLNELDGQGWAFDRLIVTGGEMAQALMDQVGAEGTHVIQLLAPLVGQGIICRGVYDGREIVTKGGLVGDATLLHRLVRAPIARHS